MHLVSRLIVGVILFSLACAKSSPTSPPVPEDSSNAIAPAAGGGDSCTASADCPGAERVRCAGAGEGRCGSEDGVGCRFVPASGPPQVRCCDGSDSCTFTALPSG
ncbi:hypothetical protein [Nannocystis radixulma]|uniref:Uncharacterized protein n=1 Tax=Nannocystis radixulma TaxID=2995305 RepID=A0ABT5BIG4_9BACT|nr:hypothetical protein [Nannocystis radixulma]MDC0673954.1 hypothetical protein [Nannocystis radixulma]